METKVSRCVLEAAVKLLWMNASDFSSLEDNGFCWTFCPQKLEENCFALGYDN